MEAHLYKNKFTHYVLIIVGTFLMAVSVNVVYEPLQMVTGGLSGLAIVIKKVTGVFVEGGIPLWLTNLMLNIPLFITAIIVRGKTFVKHALFAEVSFTIALALVPTSFNFIGQDYLLAAVFGGVIGGVGIGLVFAANASTGGTDLLAMIIHKFKPYYSVPRILTVVDGIVVMVGIISFGITKALYAIIAVYITTKISDSILEGLKFAKMAYIISDEYERIAEKIMAELDRGVTGISATGMYSNRDKKMLFCVVSKKEIVEIKELVAEVDPKAFIIVSDAREVMGEGFREYRQ
ncbi:YitT family protein [Anaerocolumna xylanovorans]|uniref:Uncharacterized membrane-anchored protein YitT, contains DUF161 and DUF2179 domains n=1 Tax=Anaerocolumna xylanovorans DSM 12503 TaxID=1121345 RepID=A0A1M7Y7T1_9FIRM|nr:YitT family protein [Anaerocolumna xylanovorans]SHO48679.1 Uncharacterized membrane-anchored protein YitT, contains DUF161 and DUF2179 domains [Anaerocolumna xylanovorans DSM 12503]